MITAVVLGLALISSDGGSTRPQLLEANAACRLIKRSRIPGDKAYSISGAYHRGSHWTSLEVSGCDEAVAAAVVPGSAADAKIFAYHDAFNGKCGSQLIGDLVSGEFSGKFIRRRVKLPMVESPPVMTTIFLISDIESDELTPASITCGK